jgi:O-antigen ligase
MVLAALAFFLFWSWRRRWLYGLGLMLCLSLMLLSNSATALVSAAVMLLLWPVWRLLRWRYRMAIPFAIVITISSVSLATWLLAGVELEQATAAAGRSISLTGRVPLWDEVLTMIAQRPWLGYGYNSFWLGWNGPSALVWESVRWDPVHAHNGFLDLVLDLGVVGLGLFALSFIFSLPRAINAARWGADASALWPLYYLVFMLLYNMTESSILRQNNILWALYVATVLSLARLSNQIIVQKEQHNAR